MTQRDALTISAPESPLTVYVDRVTALPVGLVLRQEGRQVRAVIAAELNIAIGGHDVRNPVGGISYEGTQNLRGAASDSGRDITLVHRGDCVETEIETQFGDLDVVIIYRLHPTSPYVDIDLRISSNELVRVRDVQLSLSVSIPGGEPKHVNAPGNHIRPDLNLAELIDSRANVSPLGGLEGSGGLICLSGSDAALTLWPTTVSEIPSVTLSASDAQTLETHISGLFAGEVGNRRAASVRLLTLDLLAGGFDEVRQHWPRWAARYSLTTPGNPPAWMSSASIYEVQTGPALFWGGHTYEPYSSVADVTADLDRIQQLGFSVIQLMPRHPYPSYNVHDYWDIETTYGDVADLLDLVEHCHTRGMWIILDVLLHGVLDQQFIEQTMELVRTGPYAERLDEELIDVFSQPTPDQYLIAWSRHILDFGPSWSSGAPVHSPLEDEYPDWFFRDEAGRITGVYTKAFDARHYGMQEYLKSGLIHLMSQLGIDGFRFDAPTYNAFDNWADWASGRASASRLGCVPFFEDLRQELRAINPAALLYTEPSGHLLRRSMDLNYNYDETWLVSALGTTVPTPAYWVRTAHDFMRWHEDRDAFLPRGSATAHHVDSHDSFWWSDWGQKWRREQMPLAKVQALTATYLSLDGPFMMYTGGESGIEEVLALLNRIRREHPELWATPGQFQHNEHQSEHLYWMRRESADRRLDVIVNLSGDASVSLPAAGLTNELSEVLLLRADLSDKRVDVHPNGYLVVATKAQLTTPPSEASRWP